MESAGVFGEATIEGNKLVLSFEKFPGHGTVTVRAISSGFVTEVKFDIRVTDYNIKIELFNGSGANINEGDEVSGVITGKVTISNKIATMLNSTRTSEPSVPTSQVTWLIPTTGNEPFRLIQHRFMTAKISLACMYIQKY